MKKEKTIRKIAYIVMAMMLVISTVFTGVGTMGVMEAKAADEPAGRGTDWDYLYSEIRANGSGKAYPVGTRIYMDNSRSIYFSSLEHVVAIGLIQIKEETDPKFDIYKGIYYPAGSVIELEESVSGNRSQKIKSGGYWIFIESDNGDNFYGIEASSTNDGYKDVKVNESDYEIVDKQIRELNVNVDWSKLPSLTVGTEIGSRASNLPVIPAEAAVVVSSEIADIGFGWAIQLKEEFVEKNYISEANYNYCNTTFNGLASVGMLDSQYKISADDIYYGYVFIKAKSGYKFSDTVGEDVSNIIKSNASNLFALTDGESENSKGDRVAIFLRLGTPSEIENIKNGGSSTIIKGDGYEFDTETGKLTIASDTGMVNFVQDKVAGKIDIKNATSIEIQSGVTKIKGFVFRDLKSLTSVSIADTVNTIENNVFSGCSALESITIPSSVTKIDTMAFSSCTALKEVNVEGTSPATIGSEVFYNTLFVTNGKKGIKVPTGTVDTYKDKWSDWKDYIDGSDSGSGSAGNITPDAKVDADSPVKGAELTNSKEELLNASGIFTEAEKQQIANGSNAKVWLELDKVDLSQVSDTDQAAILAKAKDFMGEGTELTYFDASLFKQIDGQTAAKVSEPGISMKITIKIPTELLTTDTNVNRTYTIIRLHDGQAEEITGAFDEASGSFTFETDKFSTYAIAYKDTAKNNGGNGGNQNNDDDNDDSSDNNNQTIVAGNTTNTPSTGASADASSNNASVSNGTAPKTGDSNAMMAWAVLAVVSLAGVVVFRKKRA